LAGDIELGADFREHAWLWSRVFWLLVRRYSPRSLPYQ
jgi:hypothetical protein